MISYLTRAFGNKPMDKVETKDLIDLLETFEDTDHQPRRCNTTHQFFLRHNRAARKSKLKTQATQEGAT
jgi:hypothetical protein